MKLFRAAFLYKIIQKYMKFMSARNLLQNYFPFFQQFSDAILSFTRPSPFELFTSLWSRTCVTEGTYPGNCKAIVFKQSLEP